MSTHSHVSLLQVGWGQAVGSGVRTDCENPAGDCVTPVSQALAGPEPCSVIPALTLLLFLYPGLLLLRPCLCPAPSSPPRCLLLAPQLQLLSLTLLPLLTPNPALHPDPAGLQLVHQGGQDRHRQASAVHGCRPQGGCGSGCTLCSMEGAAWAPRLCGWAGMRG